jgi:hypothetical protein
MPKPIIIDFGRSILGDQHRAEVGKKCGKHEIDDFYTDQIQLYTRVLKRYFPDFVDDTGDIFKTIIANNMETAFNIITLTDYLGICDSLFDSANVIKSNAGAAECILYIQQIYTDIKQITMQHLKNLYTNPDYKFKSSYDIVYNTFYPIYGEKKENIESLEKYKENIVSIYSSNFNLVYDKCAKPHECEDRKTSQNNNKPDHSNILYTLAINN